MKKSIVCLILALAAACALGTAGCGDWSGVSSNLPVSGGVAVINSALGKSAINLTRDVMWSDRSSKDGKGKSGSKQGPTDRD